MNFKDVDNEQRDKKRFYNPVISRFFFSRFPGIFLWATFQDNVMPNAHLYFKDQKMLLHQQNIQTTIEWRDLNSKQGKLKTGNLWWIYPRL